MIKETNDYLLDVYTPQGDEEPCYCIINKATGVREVSTSILPQAIKYISDLQAGLDMVIDNEDDSDFADISNIVSITKNKLN